MKHKFYLVILLVLTLCMLSCSKMQNNELVVLPCDSTIQTSEQPIHRISFSDETGIDAECSLFSFSSDFVLTFNTWDDVDKLLNRWNSIRFDTLKYEYELLGYHNVVVQSNIIYDSLYFAAIDSLGLYEHDLYDDDFEAESSLFDDIFATSLSNYINYLSLHVKTIENDSLFVIEPIGNLDLFALGNSEGYFIVDGVLYKQIEDVIICSYDELDISIIQHLETLEDLQDLLQEETPNNIYISSYNHTPMTSNWSVEEYWLLINAFINLNKVWINQTEIWTTPIATTNIGQYYSEISFWGTLNTSRLSSHNSSYQSSLKIINYRKKHNQNYWHRCKLPTTLFAQIETTVSYSHDWICETTENFLCSFEIEKKFYSKTLRWRSSPIDSHVEPSQLTHHDISSVDINFDNQRTTLYLVY